MKKNNRFVWWNWISRRVRNRWLMYYSRYFYNYLFIHINKTGGSSIEKALNLPFEHKTATEKKSELGNKIWDRKFTFTIVRNPWDKVVSQYHHRVMTNQNNLGNRSVEFNDWVKLVYRDKNRFYYDDNTIMFLPQWNWISSDSGEILVDFVGRYEQLEEDFNFICNEINRNSQLPHLKKSPHGNYRQYYNSDSVEIVKRWFQSDIDNFNYEF